LTRPAFFVVTNTHGRDSPAIYWDEMPRSRPRDVVYVMRLDEQPNGEELVAMPLFQLLTLYQRLKKRGKLPSRYEPAKGEVKK